MKEIFRGSSYKTDSDFKLRKMRKKSNTFLFFRRLRDDVVSLGVGMEADSLTGKKERNEI